MKGTLIFDGDCQFCRIWIERWREDLEQDVEIIAYQDLGSRYPEIDKAEFEKAIYFVDSEERVFVGAAALFRAFKVANYSHWQWLFYSKVPGLSLLIELIYQLVAKNRRTFSKVTKVLAGRDLRKPKYSKTRDLFFRGLFAVFFIAFVSAWTQIIGLVGENGIRPAEIAMAPFRELPDLMKYLWNPGFGWLATNDVALNIYCSLGVAFSVMGFLHWRRGAAAACFLLYMTLIQLGEPFMSYQWDFLLLEMSFLAIFWGPRSGEGIVWLYRFLAFRFMLAAGMVKLLSGDSVWKNLSALKYHFWSQPLANPVAYFIDKFPDIILTSMTLLMFVVEVGVPFLIFLSRRPRKVAFYLLSGLQIVFMVTGNYTFFNILSVVLFIPLLDDRDLKWWNFEQMSSPVSGVAQRLNQWIAKSRVRLAGGLIMFFFALIVLSRSLGLSEWVPDSTRYPSAIFSRVGIVNAYGLFAVMTKERKEIIVEGSADGKEWKKYLFKHKPDSVDEMPTFVAPHQPRLDWQMWFASLSGFTQQEWLQRFAHKLLTDPKDVNSLLEKNPFGEAPPEYLRMRTESYMFSDFSALKEDGEWWEVYEKKPYSPTLAVDVEGRLVRTN